MIKCNFVKISPAWVLILLILLAVGPTATLAQGGSSVTELRQKAKELMDQMKYTEALPVLQELTLAAPNDADAQFHLGFALMAQANSTGDPDMRRALRIRSRNAFIRAKELGVTEPIVVALIQSLPADGSDGADGSPSADANQAMPTVIRHRRSLNRKSTI